MIERKMKISVKKIKILVKKMSITWYHKNIEKTLCKYVCLLDSSHFSLMSNSSARRLVV